MKNALIATLTAFILLPAQAAAADRSADRAPQISVRLGLSGSPSVAGLYFALGDSSWEHYGTLDNIYSDTEGSVYTPGTFIGGIDMKFNKVIAVCLDLGVNTLWTEQFSTLAGGKTGIRSGTALYLVPKLKLFYLDRTYVRLYGNIGLGMGRYFGEYPEKSSLLFGSPFKLELQAAPFGIEVGRKFFGFAEFGIGTLFMGVHLGAGYKF